MAKFHRWKVVNGRRRKFIESHSLRTGSCDLWAEHGEFFKASTISDIIVIFIILFVFEPNRLYFFTLTLKVCFVGWLTKTFVNVIAAESHFKKCETNSP